MRTRNVFTAFGLGAFTLLCLTPDEAQAQRRRGIFGRGSGWDGPVVYDQSWQPGYYGAAMPYWPGTAYGPGVSYGPGMSYATQMYQPQPYGYQPLATPGCPPGQPLPPSALASPAPQAMPSTPGAATGQPAATHTVGAHDDYFEPKTLNIQPGATVTWTNRGKHAHTVTFDVGRDSGDIQPGGSFSATFPHAGTYNYHCHHHEGMTGTVVVGEGGGTGGTGGSTGTRY